MARIENASPPQDREALKREIRTEIRGEERRGKLRRFGGCVLLLLALLAVPAVWVASIVARTGYFAVPVLTKALYKPHPPVRAVAPLSGTTAEDVMRTLPLKLRCDPVSAMCKLPLEEHEMTTLLQKAIADAPESAKPPFPLHGAQVAFEPDMMEVYGYTPRDGRNVTVSARFLPAVVDSNITFSVLSVTFGNQEVPRWMAQGILDALTRGVMEAAAPAIGAIGRPTETVLSKGKLTLTFYRP